MGKSKKKNKQKYQEDREKQEKRRKAKRRSEEAYFVIAHIVAVVVTVTLVLMGIVIWADISTVKGNTELFVKGFNVEDLGTDTDAVEGTIKGCNVDTIPGSKINAVWLYEDTSSTTDSEDANTTYEKTAITNKPLSFWEYSKDFFKYYITSVIVSILILSTVIMTENLKILLLLICYTALSMFEFLVAYAYSEGLAYCDGAGYIVLVVAVCVLVMKVAYAIKQNEKWYQEG